MLPQPLFQISSSEESYESTDLDLYVPGTPRALPQSGLIDHLEAASALERHRAKLEQCRRWFQYTITIERDIALLRSWQRESTWFPLRRPSHLRNALTALRRHKQLLLSELRTLRIDLRQLVQRVNDTLQALGR